MALEAPVVSAVMARLADPAIHLAAYGGVVFPVALTVEAPVIMLLAASVALATDAAASRLIYRMMMVLGAALTLLHAVLAFTPLFDAVVLPLLDPPADVIEPARRGLQLMLPWTWAIGYRRFHQGLLIRYGRSHHVSIGTLVRLSGVATTSVLVGLVFHQAGIVAATSAIAVGVTLEALYSGWAALPVTPHRLRHASSATAPLTLGSFLRFYLPLVLTGLLSLLVQPIGSAAIARMPGALASLAVWPVANGLLFMLRSLGFALNEVVVAHLDRPGAYRALRRFTVLLAGTLLVVSLAVAFTPLARLWFGVVSGLPADLMTLAIVGFGWAVAWPALDAVRNLVQGLAVFTRRTSSISASMILFLAVSAAILGTGIVLQRFMALPVAMVAFVVATAAQVAWLWSAVRGPTRALRAHVLDRRSP